MKSRKHNVSRETFFPAFRKAAATAVILAAALFIAATVAGRCVFGIYFGDIPVGSAASLGAAKAIILEARTVFEEETGLDNSVLPEAKIRFSLSGEKESDEILRERLLRKMYGVGVDGYKVRFEGKTLFCGLSESEISAAINLTDAYYKGVVGLSDGGVSEKSIASRSEVLKTVVRAGDIVPQSEQLRILGYHEFKDTYEALLSSEEEMCYSSETVVFTPELNLSPRTRGEESPMIVLSETTSEKISEEIPFETVITYSDELKAGTKKQHSVGAPGKKTVSYLISKQDGEIVSRETLSEEIIEEPVSEVVCFGTMRHPEGNRGRFICPCSGILTSGYGERYLFGKNALHKGCDIGAPDGTEIISSEEGVVTHAGENGNGYGIHVIIDHGDGYSTLYAHMRKTVVSAGDSVLQGQKIGEVGLTGQTTGYHLHFEILKDGVAANPLEYIAVR